MIKPHLTQFFEVKKIGDTPDLNKDGFWKKPDKTSADEVKRQLRDGKFNAKTD